MRIRARHVSTPQARNAVESPIVEARSQRSLLWIALALLTLSILGGCSAASDGGEPSVRHRWRRRRRQFDPPDPAAAGGAEPTRCSGPRRPCPGAPRGPCPRTRCRSRATAPPSNKSDHSGCEHLGERPGGRRRRCASRPDGPGSKVRFALRPFVFPAAPTPSGGEASRWPATGQWHRAGSGVRSADQGRRRDTDFDPLARAAAGTTWVAVADGAYVRVTSADLTRAGVRAADSTGACGGGRLRRRRRVRPALRIARRARAARGTALAAGRARSRWSPGPSCPRARALRRVTSMATAARMRRSWSVSRRPCGWPRATC
jgi:hypothetical protein